MTNNHMYDAAKKKPITCMAYVQNLIIKRCPDELMQSLH